MKPPAAAIGAFALALATAGCTGTTGHLAVASTRNVADLGAALSGRAPRHVTGRSCIHVITIFPIGMPSFGEAVEDALRTSGGTVLSNVTIRYEVFDLPLLYGRACYVAEGDAS